MWLGTIWQTVCLLTLYPFQIPLIWRLNSQPTFYRLPWSCESVPPTWKSAWGQMWAGVGCPTEMGWGLWTEGWLWKGSGVPLWVWLGLGGRQQCQCHQYSPAMRWALVLAVCFSLGSLALPENQCFHQHLIKNNIEVNHLEFWWRGCLNLSSTYLSTNHLSVYIYIVEIYIYISTDNLKLR